MTTIWKHSTHALYIHKVCVPRPSPSAGSAASIQVYRVLYSAATLPARTRIDGMLPFPRSRGSNRRCTHCITTCTVITDNIISLSSVHHGSTRLSACLTILLVDVYVVFCDRSVSRTVVQFAWFVVILFSLTNK